MEYIATNYLPIESWRLLLHLSNQGWSCDPLWPTKYEWGCINSKPRWTCAIYFTSKLNKASFKKTKNKSRVVPSSHISRTGISSICIYAITTIDIKSIYMDYPKKRPHALCNSCLPPSNPTQMLICSGTSEVCFHFLECYIIDLKAFTLSHLALVTIIILMLLHLSLVPF